MKELPVIPLYHPILEYLVNPSLHNIYLAITGGCNFTYATFEKKIINHLFSS
ncbi:hypothetical protein CLAVI_000819 [Candidatus Clavichlamydia salmonicola]|uniref:hypothetical protein n=1 Tax=Candidatus Clavichlamydia salmonicola TaxID=469812 RepID=UPI00189138A3|nr:hypothetical protein [Candidatus Clavichlamydia salmonicola]MBF5051181.1 hypothetical protein [Candidatus Clavichlamydia salmonicola]